ncbi:MAG: PEP-CTERM sorting domain-containing protein [Lentisphaeria bacterium]
MKKFFITLAIGAPLAFACLSAHAYLITDDFNYNNTAGGTGKAGYGYLGNATSGGTGFDGNWGATTGAWTGAICTAPTDGSTTTMVHGSVVGPNLTYSGGGYNIVQTGNGMAVTTAGSDAWRGINRYIHTTPGTAGGLTGTIWFSFLMAVDSSQPFNAVQFNAHADTPYSGNDYDRGGSGSNLEVGITGDSQFRLTCGGTNVFGAAGALAVGKPHLIIGELTVGSGLDTITVWADPADINNRGTGLTGSVDIGNSLYLIGLGGNNYNANNVYAAYDALRISDIYANVVPEPASLALLALGGVLFLRRRR